MSTKLITGVIVTMGFIFAGCYRAETPNKDKFGELALQGKQIFEQYKCNACHYLGDEEAAPEGPDLTDPFIANNDLFVENHLKFIEETKMPAVELSEEEIHALSHFVGELHRAKNPPISEKEADALCPVCYAPVSRAQAKTQKLTGTYLRERYYFECQDCLDTFKTAPEAFIRLMEIDGIDHLKKVTSK